MKTAVLVTTFQNSTINNSRTSTATTTKLVTTFQNSTINNIDSIIYCFTERYTIYTIKIFNKLYQN